VCVKQGRAAAVLDFRGEAAGRGALESTGRNAADHCLPATRSHCSTLRGVEKAQRISQSVQESNGHGLALEAFDTAVLELYTARLPDGKG